MPRFALILVCWLAFALPTTAGEAEGVAAFDRGDYETALVEFRPLAEQGDARAQFNLGAMYLNGWGVPRDVGEALRWYRLAADHGLADAQFIVGFMYGAGRGVRQDTVAARRWYRKAAEHGDNAAEMAREWQKKHGKSD